MNQHSHPRSGLSRGSALAALALCAALAAGAATPANAQAPAEGEPACLDAELAALHAATVSSPVPYGLQRMRDHDVLVLGEYHRLAPQIDYVAELILAAAAAGLSFDVGVEMLPAASQAELDALVTGDDLDTARWWSIVRASYLPGPLLIQDYERVVRAIVQVNRGREDTVRLIGLQPDCSPDANGDALGALYCEGQRDAYIAERADAEVLAQGRKLLLYAGSRHAALRLVQPDGIPLDNAATLLAARHPGTVFSVHLGGPGALDPSADPPEWAPLGGGLFDQLYTRFGGPFAVDLDTPPFDALGYAAVDSVGYFRGEMPLRDAYHGLVYLMPPDQMPRPLELPYEFFAGTPPETYTRWNAFLVDVLERNSAWQTQGAYGWSESAAADARARGGFQLKTGRWCDHPARWQARVRDATAVGERVGKAMVAHEWIAGETTAEYFWRALGAPTAETLTVDDTLATLTLSYPGLTAVFTAGADETTPLLQRLELAGEALDIARPEGTLAPQEF